MLRDEDEVALTGESFDHEGLNNAREYSFNNTKDDEEEEEREEDGTNNEPGTVQNRRGWKNLLLGPKGNPETMQVFERANCLTKPISLSLSLVIAHAWILNLEENGSEPFFHSNSVSLSTGETFVQSVVYASIILGGIIVLTFGFVWMYAKRMRVGIWSVTGLCFTSALFALPCYVVVRAAEHWSFPLDWVSLAFVLWNVSVCGAVCILFREELGIPRRVANFVLILVALGLTWPLCSLPEWTLWLLVVFMILWDIIAVLTPCGPLGYAVALERERRWMGRTFDLPSGMVYEGELYALGLMDLVFYGVVVGRAAIVGWCCTVACFVAVLAGLFLTIVVTPDGATIPALPITLAVGILVYFGTKYSLYPFVVDTVSAFRCV